MGETKNGAARFDDRIRQLLREELLGALAPLELPPPADLDAEARVLNAILNGVVTHAALTVDSSHFYSSLYGRIFESSKHTLAIGELAYAAVRSGLHSGKVVLLEELNELKNGWPLIDQKKVLSSSDRIVELSVRRGLLGELQSICKGLRGGLMSTEAMARLSFLL